MGGVSSLFKKKKDVPKFLTKEDDLNESKGKFIRGIGGIATDYMALPILLYPVQTEGNKEKKEKFQLLQEQKACLSNSEKKVNYDKEKNNDIGLSYKEWNGVKNHLKQTMHWSPTSGPSSLVKVGVTVSRRRASEGGVNLYPASIQSASSWKNQASGKVITNFRNKEI